MVVDLIPVSTETLLRPTTLIAGSSFLPGVPGSADLSEWSRIWGPGGSNTGSFGFDKPCPATQMPDVCPRVAHKRRRLHRDKHKDYERRAKPAQHPAVPTSPLVLAERGLHQRACQLVRTHWPGWSEAAGCY